METIIQSSIIQPVFQKIYEIRGQKVMFDFDLAELYGVETKVLNQAVKRNIRRFPLDFMFQLTKDEFISYFGFQFPSSEEVQKSENEADPYLRSQFVTSSEQAFDNQEGCQRSQFVTINRIKYLPYAFTEQGVAMLSGILNSDRAISVNIAIMRAFVALRQYALNYADLSHRLDEFMKTTDSSISDIFGVLEELTAQKKLYENRKPIGFVV